MHTKKTLKDTKIYIVQFAYNEGFMNVNFFFFTIAYWISAKTFITCTTLIPSKYVAQ